MAVTTACARLLITAALTLTLVACGAANPPGGGTNPPGTNPPGATNPPAAVTDACAVVTDAELKSVTGLDVDKKGPTGLIPVLDAQCDYEFRVDSVFNNAGLTLAIKATGGRAFYETYFEPFIGEDSGYLETVIPGVGDKAAHGSGVVMAVKGDTLIDVQWIGLGDNRDDEMPIKIAQLVLSKLP